MVIAGIIPHSCGELPSKACTVIAIEAVRQKTAGETLIAHGAGGQL